MRILFMGSPDFALPSLEALAANYEIVAVFTQPDQRSGRGRQMTPPPVKVRAISLGLPLYQPDSLKDVTTQDIIKEIGPDVIVVTAYGKILPDEILSIPHVGCINVHASLLPRWRGAAPIQAAILAGDEETGITIMQMDPGLDTGPIYAQERLPISSTDTGGVLSLRLATLGASTLIDAMPGILTGNIQAVSQEESLATYAPMLKKKDGELDFLKPASSLALQVRAYEPWPSSYFIWNDTRIVVREARAKESESNAPGTCLEYDRFPAVAANPGILVLTTIQPAGKKAMPGDTFLNGAKDFCNERITNPTAA